MSISNVEADGFYNHNSGFSSQINFDTPIQNFGSPIQNFGAPPQNYGAPTQNYNAPSNGYGNEPSAYGEELDFDLAPLVVFLLGRGSSTVFEKLWEGGQKSKSTNEMSFR